MRSRSVILVLFLALPLGLALVLIRDSGIALPGRSGAYSLSAGASPVPMVASGPIVVTANDETIDGVSITSSSTSGIGIQAWGTAATPIKNLIIRNCLISGFNTAIDVRYVTNVTIENCTILNAAYAGIRVLSGVGGTISRNTVSFIGPQDQAASNACAVTENTPGECDAYGIDLERIATTSLTANPQSTDWNVIGNTVTDVPTWHCYDTHAGLNITFTNNVATRCMRAVFITEDSVGYHSAHVSWTNSVTTEAKGYPAGMATGTNLAAVTLFGLQDGTFSGDQFSASYGQPSIYDFQGKSIGITTSGNTTIP